MISDATLEAAVARIQEEPELWGCVIGFQGQGRSMILYEGDLTSPNYGRVIVLIEVTDELEAEIPVAEASEPVVEPELPPVIRNESRIRTEAVGAGLTCGFAVLSAVGILVGAAAEVPSGGTSTVLVVAAYTGFATSSLQCINGVYRFSEAVVHPERNSIQQLDRSENYRLATGVVDVIGLASGIAQLPNAARNLVAVLQRRGGLVTAQQLEKMTRAERKRAIEEAVEAASKTPEGRAAVEGAMKGAKFNPKQAARMAGQSRKGVSVGPSTLRQTKRVAEVLSKEAATRLNRTLRDLLGGVGALGANATPATHVGAASGTLNSIIVHVLGSDGE